jgi:hypothetical protein
MIYRCECQIWGGGLKNLVRGEHFPEMDFHHVE